MCAFTLIFLEFWKRSKLAETRHFRKLGPKTRDCWWNSRPETRDPTHRKDMGLENGILKMGLETLDPGPNSEVGSGTRDPRPGTLKVDFQQILSVFFETWHLWMNSFDLCVYVYFACFSLPYHKAYTFLIFYPHYELLFPSFFRCSCYEIFKFPTKPLIAVTS